MDPIIKNVRRTTRNEAKSESDKASPRLMYMLTQRIVNYHSASIDKHRRWRHVYRIAYVFLTALRLFIPPIGSRGAACGHPRSRYRYRFRRRRRRSRRVANWSRESRWCPTCEIESRNSRQNVGDRPRNIFRVIGSLKKFRRKEILRYFINRFAWKKTWLKRPEKSNRPFNDIYFFHPLRTTVFIIYGVARFSNPTERADTRL